MLLVVYTCTHIIPSTLTNTCMYTHAHPTHMYMHLCANTEAHTLAGYAHVHTRMLPSPQALPKEHLATVVFRPGHYALGGSLVHDDGGVETLGKGEGQGHQPDARNNRSGARG